MVDFDTHARERTNWVEQTGGPAQGGVTVLDWFAGRVLEGFIASPKYQGSMEDYVHDAYSVAELVLKERERRGAVKAVVAGVTGKTYG